MAEAAAERASGFPRWLAVGGLAVLICVATLLAGPARAASPAGFGTEGEKSLPVPGGFQLQAGNGYSLVVLALPPRAGSLGRLLIFVSGKHGEVTYSAPATVTETSIQANLGALGEISVTFQRSGRAATDHSRCGGEPVSFDSGHYEGTIQFHGEEGYTDVEATSVPGNIDFLLESVCGFSGGGGRSSPRSSGAELRIRNPALGAELWVVKRRPSAAAQIEAVDREFVIGISISRSTGVRIPAGGFTYDSRLRTATLRPPGPIFSGTASYDRGTKAGKRWSGDLTVDMPGHSGLSLTGPALRATLTPSG